MTDFKSFFKFPFIRIQKNLQTSKKWFDNLAFNNLFSPSSSKVKLENFIILEPYSMTNSKFYQKWRALKELGSLRYLCLVFLIRIQKNLKTSKK